MEGLLKQDMKTQWRKIHLLGGKPMISNSFGKRVPFVLEPSGLNAPDDCDDNYICGTCVRDNETALRWKGSSRMVHSTVTQQEAINQGKESLCSMSWLTIALLPFYVNLVPDFTMQCTLFCN